MRRLARHFATEKYYRRPVAGDGIFGLPSWVDYALEGSAFILGKYYFSRMFHTERS